MMKHLPLLLALICIAAVWVWVIWQACLVLVLAQVVR